MPAAPSDLKPYPKAPIIEAVIQLNFEEALSQSDYRKVTKRLRREYPNFLNQERVEGNVNLQARSVEFDARPQARLSSDDEADILLARTDVLSWSRLAPYQSWEPFVTRARRDFEIAHSITGPRKLSRIGVRYINRLDVPKKGHLVYYEDYLAINIDLPKEWESVQNYAWRFEREYPDQKLLAIVQSATTAPELPNTGAFFLDIDVVALDDLPVRIEKLFSRLEGMRRLKNDIFEISITDEARASFANA